MADRAKKVSELTSLTAASGDDLLLIVDDPSGTPATKKITVDAFFTATPNASFANLEVTDTANVASLKVNYIQMPAGTLSELSGVQANTVSVDSSFGFKILNDRTPATNNPTTEFGAPIAPGYAGTLFWDENYLYIAVSNTVIKRVLLTAF